MPARKRPCEAGKHCAWKQGDVCAAFPIRVERRGEFYPAYRTIRSVSVDECAELYVATRLIGADPPEEHMEFFNQKVLPVPAENTRRLARNKAASVREPIGSQLF